MQSRSSVNGLCDTFFLSTALILFGLGLPSLCTGFKCYVCNSAFQRDCDEKPVPRKYLVTCTPSAAHAVSPPTFCELEREREREMAGDYIMPTSLPGAGAGKGMQIMPMPTEISRFSIPLDANFTFCRKQIYTIPMQTNGLVTMQRTSRVARSCGYIERQKTGCKRTDKYGNLNNFCQCTKDSCNKAAGRTSPTCLMFLTLFLFAGVLSSTSTTGSN